MRINLIVQLYFLLLFTNLSSAQDWFTQQVSESVSLDFPIAPETSTTNGMTVYTVNINEAFCMATVVNVRGKIDENANPQNLYESYLEGALASANGKLLQRENFYVNGVPGLEIIYTASSNSDLPDLRQKRVMLYDQNLISFEYWTYSNSTDTVQSSKAKFFSSLGF
jgi:hypothetical protein